jgi:predicted Rossmann fold nucleotide-binding protein DprA/Smf involved in DNA uptake
VSGGDEAGRLVRPFTLTGGRTRPSRADFTLITTVTAVDPPPEPAARPQPEHTRILRLCARPVAVAELAAHLDLPVSVVVIMLCDLLEAGLITARPPRPVSRTQDLELLQKVRDGLGRI